MGGTNTQAPPMGSADEALKAFGGAGGGIPINLQFGSAAPPTPDFTGAAREQAEAGTLANRPNQMGPVGSVGWTQDPTTGQWTQTQGFSGPFADIFQQLGGQAQQSLASPLDFSGLPELDFGQGARDQAIEAEFGQARSRLDPIFAQREQQLESRLAAQGLAPGSEAARNAQRSFDTSRTDAYNTALNSAIGRGREAGESIFRQSSAARAQALGELLRQRSGPLGELGQLMDLNRQPGFVPTQAPNLLGALGLQSEADWRGYDANNTSLTELLQALGGLIPG